MFRNTLFLALAATGLAGAAHADDTFISPSVADARQAVREAAVRNSALAKKGGPEARVAAVTAEEVGDADSFGKNIKWLGLLAGNIYLTTDCTPPPGDPPIPGCITVNPAPGFTSFNVPDLATITLPGKSSETLLCHWQTPIVNYFAANNTGGPQNFQLRATATYRFESPVLDDPTLLDPNTGLPYGGQINTALTSIIKSHTMQSGEFESEQDTGTRMCIAGIISRNALINQYGLSEAQAKQFFKKPITITMGISGNVRLVEDASIYFGTRFAGD